MKKIVLVDLDSTIVHTTEAWLKVLNATFNKNITLSDLKDWEDIHRFFGKKESKSILFSENFYKNHVKPIEGAYEFLMSINALGYDVKLLTASPKSNSKIDYINENFPNVFSELIFEIDKTKVHGDIIIDDAPHNVIPHMRTHKSLGFLYNHNGTYQYNDVLWSNPQFFRVKNYSKILEILESKGG